MYGDEEETGADDPKYGRTRSGQVQDRDGSAVDGNALLICVDLALEQRHVLVLLLDLEADVRDSPEDDQDEGRGEQAVHKQNQEHAHVVALVVDHVPQQPIGQPVDIRCRLEIVPVEEVRPGPDVLAGLT